MSKNAHYHQFKARHRLASEKRPGRHLKPTRRQRLSAMVELLWVRVWAPLDARAALGLA